MKSNLLLYGILKSGAERAFNWKANKGCDLLPYSVDLLEMFPVLS